MAQLLKIDSNAPAEVARLKTVVKNWRDAIPRAITAALELARQRVEQQTVPGGAIPGKTRGFKYVPTPGATIRRRNKQTGALYGPPIFNKLRVVSRSGLFLGAFQRGESAGLITRIEQSGATITGVFGVQRAAEEHAKKQELKSGGRKPIWKGLQYVTREGKAGSRWETLLYSQLKPMEAAFNG